MKKKWVKPQIKRVVWLSPRVSVHCPVDVADDLEEDREWIMYMASK
jgi:hypothetical protein